MILPCFPPNSPGMFPAFFDFYLCSSSLLKTFSINPFQGQYPNRAVIMNTTPIIPTTHRKIPSMEKAKMTKMTPMIERKIASILPTFFVLIMGSIQFPPVLPIFLTLPADLMHRSGLLSRFFIRYQRFSTPGLGPFLAESLQDLPLLPNRKVRVGRVAFPIRLLNECNGVFGNDGLCADPLTLLRSPTGFDRVR